MAQVRIRQWALGLMLLGSGLMAGAATISANVAQGEVRATPQPQSFQTGGQLSLPVLKEIAATLHQIDARLARLEAAAQKMAAGRQGNLDTGGER